MTLALEGFTRQRDNELAGVGDRIFAMLHEIIIDSPPLKFSFSSKLFPEKVERAAEARVAREQKRAAEQEEAARCHL